MRFNGVKRHLLQLGVVHCNVNPFLACSFPLYKLATMIPLLFLR